MLRKVDSLQTFRRRNDPQSFHPDEGLIDFWWIVTDKISGQVHQPERASLRFELPEPMPVVIIEPDARAFRLTREISVDSVPGWMGARPFLQMTVCTANLSFCDDSSLNYRSGRLTVICFGIQSLNSARLEQGLLPARFSELERSGFRCKLRSHADTGASVPALRNT